MTEYDEKTLNLIRAIADYGHYAQPFLSDVNNWTLGKDYAVMTEFYTGFYDMSTIREAGKNYSLTKDVSNSDITRVTYRLVLESETMLDVFMTVKEGTELTASASFNGTTYTAEKQSDGRYRVRISGISALQFGDNISISGNARGNFTINVSALAYVRNVLNSDSFGDDAKDAMAAFYKYCEAAIAYN